MRTCLFLLAAALPAAALAQSAPRYAPMTGWSSTGYKETTQKDGSWRIVAGIGPGIHTSDAIDMAMYRAAELARDAGYPYVELLGGSGSRGPAGGTAILFARPSRTAAEPATCPSKKPGTCYTASVAELLHRLGGADGTQPGVPIFDQRDELGRPMSVSGYGVGRARKFVPLPVAQIARPATSAIKPDPAAAYAAKLKTAQPVHGREPSQGWTVSD